MTAERTKQKTAIIVTVSVLATAAVLTGIALAVYFTWPKEYTLNGNFTILQKNISQVSNSSICSYLTTTLTNSKLDASQCIIEDKRSGSVLVRYRLVIKSSSGEDILQLASTAIATATSSNSVFIIDQTSVTFEDESGVAQNNCRSSPCAADSNAVCVSIVRSYQCVCISGYSKSDGLCALTQKYCAPTETWIPKAKLCDKFQDCPDDSDETNCVCNPSYQYGCQKGRCIYQQWLCDGVKDCPLGDDELAPQCQECSSSQFQCSNPRSCISKIQQCDGISDCADSSDESRCVSLGQTGLLNVTYHGTSGYRVCPDNWNATWSDRVCKVMGFGTSSSFSSTPSSDPLLKLTPGATSSNFMAFLSAGGSCSTQSAVTVNCEASVCGTRAPTSVGIEPYILNGHLAAKGAWPWQAVVYTGYTSGGYFQGKFLCGGILINDRWILTAAHCTQITEYNPQIGYTGQVKPQNLLILMGMISRESSNPDIKYFDADRVFTHPFYDSEAITNDVGLIRLSQPVSFTDTIRPICLPSPDQDLSRFKVCVDTGFGKTVRDTSSNDLFQAKMNILPDVECSQNIKSFNRETQICIGTVPTAGDINICSGDSGGPLSCQDPSGLWMAIGVNSYVFGSAGSAVSQCRQSVVARVPTFVDWIQATVSTNPI